MLLYNYIIYEQCIVIYEFLWFLQYCITYDKEKIMLYTIYDKDMYYSITLNY